MIGVIVAEYNPFHNGHLYHIEKTKQILQSLYPDQQNYIVAIMSGNFTERGDIAILNKYTRAKHAIFAGVDMVIELPCIYATSSAEFFANGAMQIAKKINNLGLISFGAEDDDIQLLTKIANATEQEQYNQIVKQNVSLGLSYPTSCEIALKKICEIDAEITKKPNNILAIQYIKQAQKLGINTKFVAIKRVGNDYNQSELSSTFNSAKAIRTALFKQNCNFEDLKIPKYVYDDILNSCIDYQKLFAIASAKSLDISNVYEDNEGIINRIKKYANIAKNYDELVELVHTKRYTKSKIKRILAHIALNHCQKDLIPIEKPNVLAIRDNCKHLLSQINFDGNDDMILQNEYSDKIYNILSNDKITTNKMQIITHNTDF